MYVTKIWVYGWFFFLAITVDVFEHPHLHVLVFLYLIFITINTWGVFFFFLNNSNKVFLKKQ